jgi:hypothetical protein
VSSVYTEYFVRGTQPDESCDLHANRSIFSRIAGWVGGAPPAAPVQERAGDRRADADANEDRRAEAEVRDEDRDEPGDDAEAPKKKKRGFWSRLFGRGDKNDEKKPKR